MRNTTREVILDAALHLFSKRGYEGVGVQEVVEAAGVTKPTLYYHFKSKQGVLATLLEERLGPGLAAIGGLAVTGDVESDLRRCAETLFDFADRNPDMYRLFLSFIFAPPESPQFREAATHAQRQFQAIERLFGTASGSTALQVDTALHAAAFQGTLHNYITLFLLGYARLDRRAAHDVVHRFIHGIGQEYTARRGQQQ